MRAIPVLIRERIILLYKQGRTTAQIAQSFGFCEAAVRRVRQQFKERKSLVPKTHLCGRKSLLTKKRQRRLEKLVADQPDATLAELGARMDRPFGTSTLDLWLRRLGFSYKKNASCRRTKPSRRGEKKEALARTISKEKNQCPGVRR